MLESEIKKLTAAVDANTAALLNGTAPAATADTLKPAAQAKPVAAPPTPAAPAPGGATVSKKTLTDTFIKLAQTKGREIAAGILAEFGVTKLPELKDETQWPAFHAKVVAALAVV